MPSGSWIRLDGIRFQCVIGVTEPERSQPQDIVVSVEIRVDFAKAAASDSIQDTVDYRRLSRRIIELGQASRFHLVEALVTHLGRVLLDEFPPIEALRIELEKPGALRTTAVVRAVIVTERDHR